MRVLESFTIASVRMEPIVSYLSNIIPGLRLDPDVILLAGMAYGMLYSYVFVRARRHYGSLLELKPYRPQPDPPDCMVVIPARNEEDSVGRAVRSLPADSVLVIDDQSQDQTASQAEAAGAGVHRIAQLPDRALGKPYACSVGARAVNTKWILFADADTWYEAGILESLVQAAEVNNLSFLSLYPAMESESLAEHILTPYCQALYFAAVNPTKCPEGAFDGHCVLVRREAYEFIGGHASNSTFLVDDLRLAMLAQRHRMKLGLARSSHLAHARFHRGWTGLWEGIARNAFKVMLLPPNVWLTLVLVILLNLMWLPFTGLMFATGWTLAGGFLLVLPFAMLTPWYRNPIRTLLAPIAFFAVLPMAAHALYCVIASHRVSWKGREVS